MQMADVEILSVSRMSLLSSADENTTQLCMQQPQRSSINWAIFFLLVMYESAAADWFRRVAELDHISGRVQRAWNNLECFGILDLGSQIRKHGLADTQFFLGNYYLDGIGPETKQKR